MRKMERMETGRTQWGTDPRAAYSSRPTRPQSPASASSKAENVQDPRGGGGNPRGAGVDWLAAPSPGAICCRPTHLTQSASRRPHVQPFKPRRRPRGAQVSLERRGEWAGGLPLVRPSAMAALAGPGRLWGSGLEPGARHEGLRGLWGRPLGPSLAWLWARSGCEDLGPAGQGGLRNLLLSAQAAVFSEETVFEHPWWSSTPYVEEMGAATLRHSPLPVSKASASRVISEGTQREISWMSQTLPVHLTCSKPFGNPLRENKDFGQT